MYGIYTFCGRTTFLANINNISGENLFMFDITKLVKFAVICNSNNNNKTQQEIKNKNKNCFMNTYTTLCGSFFQKTKTI